MANTNSEQPEQEQFPILMTSRVRGNLPIRVLVVGAGGTGGRVIPPLMQILRRGDSVGIVDGDHVEDRNLVRQNFRQRDVGENKAEVMARRYRRDGINVDVYATMLHDELPLGEIMAGSSLRPDSPRIIIGAVDNWKARQTMHRIVTGATYPCMWIDGGNERRGGQAIMSFRSWPMKVVGPMTQMDYGLAKNVTKSYSDAEHNWHCWGLQHSMPQLLAAKQWHCDRCDVDNEPMATVCVQCKQPEDSCRDRIDLQTVAVNQLSATCILNILSCVMYQIPLTTVGAFFSTLNTMEPIKLAEVDWSRTTLKPATTYADKAV